MEASDDEDSHLCLRCKTSIIGLDKYVEHRKRGCQRVTTPSASVSEPRDKAEANDFFHYIQLQQKPKDSHSTPGSVRVRRASSDQAALFMENLGGNTEKEACFDENLLLWPVDQSIDQALMGHPSKQTPRSSRPSLLSSWKSSQSTSLQSHETPFQPAPMSPSQADFLRQMDLINVANLGDASGPSSSQPSSKWKIWNPEQENDDLWNDVLGQSDIYFEDGGSSTVDPPQSLPLDTSISNEEPDSSTPTEDSKRCSSTTDQEKRAKRVRKQNPRYISQEAVQADEFNIMTCPTCSAQIPRFQFGKHLISHFHLNHSRVPRNDPRINELVFEHIEEIVEISPFRCDACRFFCNWDHEFNDHWRQCHADEVCPEGTAFWCSFCEFTSTKGQDVLQHLLGDKHEDIVVALGRIVPIAIRKIKLFACQDCGHNFRLRIGLQRHRLKTHDSHATRIRRTYQCLDCKLMFNTKLSFSKHQQSCASQRVRVSCEFCLFSAPSSDQLKDHVISNHFKMMSQCGMCGDKFALAQDLSAHVRGLCAQPGHREQEQLVCDEKGCSFSCHTTNMMLFHTSIKHGSKNVQDNKYSCSVCAKVLSRPRLWEHVRIHGEAFRCDQCHRIFASSAMLVKHQDTSHEKESQNLSCSKCSYSTTNKVLLIKHQKRTHFAPKPCDVCHQMFHTYKKYHRHQEEHKEGGPKLYPCQQCQYVGRTAAALKSHNDVHKSDKALATTFKCPKCDFSCLRKSQLSQHSQIHRPSHGRGLQCHLCSYCTTSDRHFQRHCATHQESKTIFHCRLCSWTTSSLDGLRKHVLATKKHVGASLYSCQFCSSFETNSSTEFKGHLMHHKLPESKAVNHVRSYFKVC